mmetsp:Transcript_27445/g.60362  ORF Transcript_27445/g.60362 Transcript_27445/m.60362 type:complete len:262 (-) Transcript_27445:131-916(-)
MIKRADLDGSNAEDFIVAGVSRPRGISIDQVNNRLFWSDQGSKAIKMADLHTGGNVQVWLQLDTEPEGLSVDTPIVDRVYWSDRPGRLRRTWLVNPEAHVEDYVVLQNNDYSMRHAIAVDHNSGLAYWPDKTLQSIQCAHADGTPSQTTVMEGVYGPHGVAVDAAGGKVYWSDNVANTIERADLDGSNPEVLVTEGKGLISPLGITLDVAAGKMYWVDRGHSVKDGSGDRVMRANMADGSEFEDLVTTGHMEPRDVAVLPI